MSVMESEPVPPNSSENLRGRADLKPSEEGDPSPPAAPMIPASSAATSHRGVFHQFRELLDMIKFEHTVFALPFAFLGALAASPTLPGWRTLSWILAAMVGARTAAMTFNRLVDADLDAENPRTLSRALPAGRVSRAGAILLLGISIVLFGFAAGMLGPLPWMLSPFALLVILGYSLCKRFTSLAHTVLGLALAGAPLGGWIAVSGRLDPPAWFLALGVLTWTAGFDVLYALQDEDFDRKRGLRSIPSRWGTARSLWISRAFHLTAVASWATFNALLGCHFFPWLAWFGVLLILFQEHWVLRGGRLDRIDHAFFTLNSFVGPLFFAGHLAEWLLGRSWMQ